MHIIEGTLEADLLKLVRETMPYEAVGLILPDRTVLRLSNRASTPKNSFDVERDEIASALEGIDNPEEVTFWHSHPGGGIGPSRIDMQHKTPFKYHLVVALIDGGLVPTWY